jgi:hypothetical protein
MPQVPEHLPSKDEFKSQYTPKSKAKQAICHTAINSNMGEMAKTMYAHVNK